LAATVFDYEALAVNAGIAFMPPVAHRRTLADRPESINLSGQHDGVVEMPGEPHGVPHPEPVATPTSGVCAPGATP